MKENCDKVFKEFLRVRRELRLHATARVFQNVSSYKTNNGPIQFFSQLSFVASDTNQEMSEMSVSNVKILLIVRFIIQEPRSYVVAEIAFHMWQHL